MSLKVDWDNISDWLVWWLAEQRLSPENQKVFDSYYTSYKRNFGDYIRRHYSNQTVEALRIIKAGSRVLEIGCGCGTESLWFAMQGATVLGIDLEEARLKVARERANYCKRVLRKDINIDFINGNIFDLRDVQGFNLIWMEQAFHHIEPREDLPAQLGALLDTNGYLVISEANAWNPLLQLALFRRRGFKTLDEYTDQSGRTHIYGVERITTASKLVHLFTKNGFEFVSKRHFRILPNIPVLTKLSWIEDLIPAGALPFYSHFNVVLRKK
jgi:2-polyprenyl-3-methyl-5-hydroxy-6-metoxy-1,4-benzoquinol methylase